MPELPHTSAKDRCTNHHHACDCREAMHAEEVAALRKQLEEATCYTAMFFATADGEAKETARKCLIDSLIALGKPEAAARFKTWMATNRGSSPKSPDSSKEADRG